VNCKTLLLACAVIGSGLFVMTGRPIPAASVFTARQAEAGRVAYQKTCFRCHTTTLMGRKGDAGELPPITSLSDADREFIRMYGPVPALAGKDFLARWEDKTLAQVIARIAEGVSAFPPEGMNSETAVEITAYTLQVGGAQAGDRPLTRTTDVTVGSIGR
jgi:mono/diheme cytochrome c family protein